MSLSDVIKKGSGAPAPSSLIVGGIGVDTTNKRLYIKAADGTVVAHDNNVPAGSIVATTVQTAINELDANKAATYAPNFTGIPTAPTASPLTSSTQLATTAFVNSAVIAANTSLDPIKKIVRGYHNFSYSTVGGKVFSRGHNPAGGIGDGSVSSNPGHQVQFPSYCAALTVDDICCIGDTRYVLFSNGDLYGWGYNAYGQLGISNVTNQPSPVLLNTNVATLYYNPLNNWGQNAPETSIIIKKYDGTFWGTGHNVHGELANGTVTSRNVWAIVPHPTNKTIATIWVGSGTGKSMFCKTTDNLIYAVGYNISGELGIGNVTQQLSWTQVNYFNTITDVIDIQTGRYYYDGTNANAGKCTMVLTASGDVYSVGQGTEGALGLGNLTSTTAFNKVTLNKPVKTLQHNGWTTYVIFTDDTYARWGHNIYGQLGDGTLVNKSSPVYSPTVVTNIFIRCRSGYSPEHLAVFICTATSVYANGHNANGSLGLGNLLIGGNVSTPTLMNISDVNISDVLLTGAAAVTTLMQVTNSNVLYSVGYNAYSELGYAPNLGDKYCLNKIYVS